MENKKTGNLDGYFKGSAHKEYVYSHLPENIRQIGETDGSLKVYIEDYVMTYAQEIFTEKQEKSIVAFLGKKGKEEAAGCIFIYGAISIKCNIMEGAKELTADKWNDVYKEMHDNFPGAQMLGWGCGVSMWNSRADAFVRQIHSKYFGEDGKLLFVTDISEREEKLFLWKQGELVEQTGFVVYYEKNPQMQEYMLKNKDGESIESAYKDNVTGNMRQVIKEKEYNKIIQVKHSSYVVAAVLAVIFFIGAGMLYSSMGKIKSLEAALAQVEDIIDSNMVKAVMTDGSLVQDDGTVKDKKNGNNTQGNNADIGDASNRAVVQDDGTGSSDSTHGDGTGSSSGSMQGDGTDGNNYNTQTPAAATTAVPSRRPAPEGAKSGSRAKKASTYNGKYESYIVSAGDTLSQIVWKQYHSFYYLDKVMKVNNIKNSDKIYEGDCIILPDFS